MRLRPILMTSFAFILGVVPLVLGRPAANVQGPSGGPWRVFDGNRFTKVVPRPARRHGLDRLAPADRPDRPAAERTRRGARPPARRKAAAVLLRPRLHQPF